MTLNLVVPDLLSPRHSGEAHPGVETPALATLLGRARTAWRPPLILEQWLARSFGLQAAEPPYAALRAHARGGGRPGASWICADPVHVRFARDTLVVGGPDELDLPAPEAGKLVAALNEHFSDLGEFVAEAPMQWSLRLARPLEVSTQPLDLVRGRQVQAFLPTGEDARLLIRSLNEIQMLLHGHPVNAQREESGRATANSVWFWGAGALPESADAPADVIHTDNAVGRGLARLAGKPAAAVPRGMDELEFSGERLLVTLEDLRGPARSGEPGAWENALARLEHDWFAPALAALKAGRIGTIRIVALQDEGCGEFAAEKPDLWKLWRRPIPPAAVSIPGAAP